MKEEKILELPRKLCSSDYQWDALWTSKVVLVASRDISVQRIQFECLAAWSPGLVLFLTSPGIDSQSLKELADFLTPRAKISGKARRLVCGTPIPQSILGEFYKCFHCVEFVSLEGKCVIVDDGQEKVVEAEIVVTAPN